MSATVQPTHSSTPWRAIVIGAVAVLAVAIGVAAGSVLLTSRATGMGAAAAYVPADAPFYLEVRVEPSAEQDAALRELLGRFPPIEGLDLDRPLHDQLVEKIDEAIDEGDTAFGWAEDVAPWFDGTLAVAVTAIDPEALTDPTTMEEPDVLVVAGVTDAAAARAAVDRLVTESGSEVTTSEHRGFQVVEAVDGEPGAYAVTDDALLAAESADVVRAALDVEAAGGSLGNADGTAGLLGQLPADWLAFGTYDLEEIMVASLQASAEMSGIPSDAFAALLEDQPLRGAFAVSAQGDRLSFDAVTEAPTGAFAVENGDRGLAEAVPGDALYYAEAGNLGAGISAAVDVMKEAVGSDPDAADELAMVETALGGDLGEFFGWIGDAAMTAGWDGAEAYAGLVIVPTDAADAERRLDQLAGFARLAMLDAESGVSVEESDVDGTEVTTIRWSDPTMVPDPTVPVPTGLAIEYAVTDEHVLIGLGDRFVDRSLELDPSDSLAANDRFTAAIEDLGGDDNAGVAWMDLRGLRETVEAVLLPTAEAMGLASYESDIKPWLEPLDRLVSVSRLEGDQLVQRGALLVD